jgi:hypothetical protein
VRFDHGPVAGPQNDNCHPSIVQVLLMGKVAIGRNHDFEALILRLIKEIPVLELLPSQLS